MTNSTRHTPIFGFSTAESDKGDKVRAHRVERRQVRIAVNVGDDLPHPKQFGNPCAAAKDGKRYVPDPDPIWMRK